MTQVYDTRQCELGEGPLWHPLRQDLLWFDIEAHKILSSTGEWQFDDYVSAAGWVDRDHVIIASASQLFRFHLDTGAREKLVDLEADNPATRSNDGRADPQGGFWIGTMGINCEPGAGAIYRYYKGELRRLFAPITISNSICFAPCGTRAYFCDTPTKQIMQVDLDADGWPKGTPSVAVDLRATGENPDGSVVDADGNIWNAQWGAGRVACYRPGGGFATSAMQGLAADERAATPTHGQTFQVDVAATGQLEHQVIL